MTPPDRSRTTKFDWWKRSPAAYLYPLGMIFLGLVLLATDTWLGIGSLKNIGQIVHSLALAFMISGLIAILIELTNRNVYTADLKSTLPQIVFRELPKGGNFARNTEGMTFSFPATFVETIPAATESNFAEAISSATQVDILETGLPISKLLEQSLIHAVRRGARARILLPSSLSSSGEYRATEMHDPDKGRSRTSVYASLAELNRIGVEVRTYNSLPTLQFYRADEAVFCAFPAPHVPDVKTLRPKIAFYGPPTAQYFASAFMMLWNSAYAVAFDEKTLSFTEADRRTDRSEDDKATRARERLVALSRASMAEVGPITWNRDDLYAR